MLRKLYTDSDLACRPLRWRLVQQHTVALSAEEYGPGRRRCACAVVLANA